MWLCFNDAFLSVVQSIRDPDVLMVRARVAEHLVAVFGDNKEIHKDSLLDYRYRVFCSRAELMGILADRIANISYSNFKDSVKDERLHEMYEDMWDLHHTFQVEKEKKQ